LSCFDFFISPSLTLLPFYAKFLFKIAKNFICFAKSAKIWHKNTKLHNIQVALWDGPAKLRKEGKAKEGGLAWTALPYNNKSIQKNAKTITKKDKS
jgi:hypothetical protein